MFSIKILQYLCGAPSSEYDSSKFQRLTAASPISKPSIWNRFDESVPALIYIQAKMKK
jgi:hypothetical protein